jgi:hypothetical protein
LEFKRIRGERLMMRTIEVLIVIVILLGSFAVISTFAVLPAPRQVAPLNLRRLALTSLQTLDFDNDLSEAAFDTDNDTIWNHVQVALSAMLPADIIYNLTIYDINSNASGTELYTPLKSVSNAENLGTASDSSQYSLASSNVTFNVVAEKIGEHGDGGTLYILNCSDANGWWITGYTAQSLASDLYKMLSPYFVKTIMVQNTTELGQILGGTPLQGENIQSAAIINTCGEAVPIPTSYCTSPYSNGEYAYYCHFLGQKVQEYNWTWASIVGYPLYYVSNTGYFTNSTDQNGWGVYGMKCVGAAGLNSFLSGLNNETYIRDTTWITLGSGGNPSKVIVCLSSNASYFSNYYGVYPYFSQTATRAVPSTIQSRYNLTAVFHVFDPADSGGKTWLAGSIFLHNNSNGDISGKFIPIGLTRSADIRITALAILSFYHPSLYGFPEYTIYGTSRLAVLQLGLAGGAGA